MNKEININFKNALISVFDKSELIKLAKNFNELGINILASGSTYKEIHDAGLTSILISDYTDFPEILDGRVKTLHPKIYGGILARRNLADDMSCLTNLGIKTIDIIICNLYPFKKILQDGATEETILENIDIGGVSLIRAGAKNFKDVLTVVSPLDYEKLFEILQKESITIDDKLYFAKKAFKYIAEYDSTIYSYFAERCGELHSKTLPFSNLLLNEPLPLRYGENNHQKAFYFVDSDYKGYSSVNAEIIWGKEISYNNFIDIDSAIDTSMEFSEKTAVIIKHTNPCGVGSGETLDEALKKAIDVDPVSFFGGVIGLNSLCDSDTANTINKHFIEAVIAPDYSEDALAILKKKKNIRIVKLKSSTKNEKSEWEIKSLKGGILAQEVNSATIDPTKFTIVTKRKPTEQEVDSLIYGMKVAKHIKSNAIVISRTDRIIGVGAGQMSRIDSVKIAIEKSKSDIKGAVLASDAFFPFRDSVDIAHTAGITAIIQPGGSIKDSEVITACDEHDIAMVFTGERHFRH